MAFKIGSLGMNYSRKDVRLAVLDNNLTVLSLGNNNWSFTLRLRYIDEDRAREIATIEYNKERRINLFKQ